MSSPKTNIYPTTRSQGASIHQPRSSTNDAGPQRLTHHVVISHAPESRIEAPVPLDTHDLQSLLHFTTEVAKSGGRIAMSHYQHTKPWKKPDGSLVTRADMEVEEAIVTQILRADPQAHILGEELGGSEKEGKPGQQWLVDPIDGTSWFALGLPIFGVLIALLVDREPVLGVIHCPALARTVSAGKGLGCWHQFGTDPATRAHVAECTSLREAKISIASLTATELAGSPERIRAPLGPIARQCGELVTAGDCVQHALVATGNLHVAIDPVMRPWDSAALIPCIREAGGSVDSLAGGGTPLVFAGSLISAANPALLRQVKEAMGVT
jgi:histidinol-phosphatase